MSKNITFEILPSIGCYAEGLDDKEGTAVCLRVDYLDSDQIGPDPIWAYYFNCAEVYLAELISKFSVPGTPYLCVHEVAHPKIGREEANTNAHYHLFMEIHSTVAALRAAVKRTWTGNAGYSLKEAKPELVAEHFNYLCKGTGTGTDDRPQVINRSDNITDDDVVTLHGLFWKNNDAIQVQKAKRHAKVSISEQIYQLCVNADTGGNKRKIADVVVGFYGSTPKRYRNPGYCRTLVYQTACWLEPTGHDATTFMDYITSNPCL